MELYDKDLLSIQEVRCLIRTAKEAQAQFANFSQQQIDNICAAMAKAGCENATRLARMANEETGFGRVEDKIIKNEFGSKGVYESIKDLKTVGIINECPENKVFEVAVPMGVIAALIPSTNPTSTVFFKALIAVKSGNAIIFSPHPSAKGCILEATRLMAAAAEAAGCPRGILNCIERPSLQATNELMKHDDIALILATGGGAMVKAAYSSGNPAIGVGPGNGPAFIESSADIPLAVKHILDSKCFDNGTICASEQSVITEDCIRDTVIDEFKRQGGYFLSDDEKAQVERILMRANGTMNPAIVGKTAQYVAKLAGFTVPDNIRVLLGFENQVGHNIPFSKEKLCPVLAFYAESSWERACERCIDILLHEGAGHTMIIHSQNDDIIRAFALSKPVSRLLVNTPGALGAIGGTTNLFPSLTLGCGAVGKNSSSDNIGPLNLINIRRVAYGTGELEGIRAASGQCGTECACATVDTDAIAERVLQRLLGMLDR